MITTDNCKDIVDLLKRDEYISDMIDIKINSKMSVSTLYALEMIFFPRPQLAQVLTRLSTSSNFRPPLNSDVRDPIS